MRRTTRGLLAFGACLSLAWGAAPARADLITTVTPTVTQLTGGAYSYSYLLANSASSTVGLSEFDMSIRPGVLLTTINAPTGFLALYTLGDPDIQFFSSDATTDIAAGSSGVFSFTGFAPPELNSDLTRGFDASSGAVFQLSGSTLTPSAVPEPSVLALSGLGGLALFGRAAYRRFRRRKA